jgi:hypothetical protein
MTVIYCDGRTEGSMYCVLLDLRSCRQDEFQANPELASPSETKMSAERRTNNAKHPSKKSL